MRSAFGGLVFAGMLALSSAAVALSAPACGGSTSDAPGSDGGPAGTSSTGDPNDPPFPGNLPCAVDTILQNNCRKCHSSPPQFGAPMPLTTLQDLHARAHSDKSKHVYELVPFKIADDADPMPPAPNARLSSDDRATLSTWANGGAPAAGANDCAATPPPDSDGGPLPGVDAGVSCKPDLDLLPASDWSMPDSAGDKYVCFGVDVNRPTPTHAVAFAPKIDNTQIVHHIVLFQSSSSYSNTPSECDAGTSLAWRMVAGWAPGNSGFELPPDVGFAVGSGSTTTHYVMQIHYSNPQGLSGQKDHSGFQLCTTTPRKYEADVVAFGTQDIHIPPSGAPYTRDCTINVDNGLGSVLAGKHVIGAMPHMHKLGTAQSTVIERSGGGTSVDIGTVANWSFNNQPWLPQDAVINAGDTIRTKCTWTNTTGAEVDFGEYTKDEMCYAFTMYYPKIQSAFWSWAAPANVSSCAQ